jgi:hypothetical protein
VTEIRTLPATTRPCQIYHYHRPRPLRTQGHHRHPVYLQNRVYGRILDADLLWVCGTCHDNLHEIISWLLGEGRMPDPLPSTHSKTWIEAKRTVDWYHTARAEKELS